MREGNLLMIPGPVELSDAVLATAGEAPPSHLAPAFVAAFGAALRDVRTVWGADDAHQPIVIAGGGTIGMEIAVTNLLEPGDAAVVVVTGFFGDRMVEMLRRRGVEATTVRCAPGEVPALADVAQALDTARPKALFATHVDTSTGARVDVEALSGLARAHDVLAVFDGVCSIGGERFEMTAWGADVMLTASQKALGGPPGLAALVFSPRAVEARRRLGVPPPLSLDLDAWIPIHQAYEDGRGAYFSTPATSLVRALGVALAEIVAFGIDERVERHARVADGFRAAFEALGLSPLCDPEHAANTLSAVRYPEGVGPELVARIVEQGVIVAGGLYPGLQRSYFRVGHMGAVVGWPDALERTVQVIGEALVECDHDADVEAALDAARPHFRSM